MAPQMIYEIEPYVGVGPIRLGMTREEVHRHIVQDRHPTMNRGRDTPGDYFPALGLFADYRTPGVCEFVEFGGPLLPVLHGQSFLGQPYRQARAWFEANDPDCETDGAGLTSKRFGIALYASSAEKRPDGPIEGVAVFEEGYYGRP
jgi:hypothetical protein